jgi:predicted DNA-binding transcriptional regulator AlpA
MTMRNSGKVEDMNAHIATDERLLSRPQVADLVGCSPAHVRRMEVGDPNFPKPVRVSAGITRWRLSDMRSYFAQLKQVTT